MYEALEAVLSAWLQIPGWTLESVFFDILHVIWLGFGRDIAACCMVDLFARGEIPGATEQEAFAKLKQELRCLTSGASKRFYLAAGVHRALSAALWVCARHVRHAQAAGELPAF